HPPRSSLFPYTTLFRSEMISFMRGPDVPGAMIPRAYFDYLQQRPSATFRSIFTRNVHDVISLAALTVHACDRVILEPAALDDPLDRKSTRLNSSHVAIS